MITYTFLSALVSGVGIGVVDIGYEKRLANHLGARGAPSILGLVNGRVTFFHSAVGRENLRHFVESLLPHNLVEKVSCHICDPSHEVRYSFTLWVISSSGSLQTPGSVSVILIPF